MDEKPTYGIFENDLGNKSYIRNMGGWSFVISVIVAGIILLKTPQATTESASIYIFTAFFIGGFAPQVVQKFAEILLPLIISKFKQN
jgi:hypothetical protein